MALAFSSAAQLVSASPAAGAAAAAVGGAAAGEGGVPCWVGIRMDPTGTARAWCPLSAQHAYSKHCSTARQTDRQALPQPLTCGAWGRGCGGRGAETGCGRSWGCMGVRVGRGRQVAR